MFGPRHFPAFTLVCALALPAQTYKPRTIRLQGADSMDRGEIMQLLDLKPGAPVTREQIEAAMQRLADSGLFADLSYTVDASALTFLVKPIPGSGSLPVLYSNFVWWQPGELDPLVRARVPLFGGKLPLTGKLTDQVVDALVALLAEKGMANAKVDAMQSTLGGSPAIALTVTQPAVTLGDIHLNGVAPEADAQMHIVTDRLSGRDLNLAETPRTLVDNTLDTHRNAGYLDAAVDAPIFSAPHQTPSGYAVDVTATVHPGSLYRIASITYDGVDPQLQPEVAKASGVKPGDMAGQMTLSIAAGLTARAYADRGMLEARATAQVTRDTATHTAAYRITVVPGPVYTFAALDLTALPLDQQSRLGTGFSAQPGQIAGAALRRQLLLALRATGNPQTFAVQAVLNHTVHTVTYVVTPKFPGTPDDPS